MGLWDSIKDFGKNVVKGISKVTGSGSVGGLIGAGLGGIPGALIGGAVDLGANWLGNELVSKPNADDAFAQSQFATAKAFDRNMRAYKHRYRNTMEDMQKAGLNPILAAASGGFNTSGQPQMQSAQAFLPTYTSQTPSSAYESMQKGDTEHFVREKLIQETGKVWQETELAFEKTFKTRAEKGLVKAQEAKIYQEVKNLKERWWNLVQKFNKISAEAYELHARKDVHYAQAEQIRAISKKLGLEMTELQKHSNLYKGPAGQVLKAIKETINALNIHTVIGIGLPQ